MKRPKFNCFGRFFFKKLNPGIFYFTCKIKSDNQQI